MDILIRLFVWILNRTYGRNKPTSLYGSNPMDEKLLAELDESRRLEREAQRQSKIVESFQSTATPVEGAVNYADLNWESYDRVVETPEQFAFYNGRSAQRIIAKSAFTSPQEIAALRRVIHRHVRRYEQRND